MDEKIIKLYQIVDLATCWTDHHLISIILTETGCTLLNLYFKINKNIDEYFMDEQTKNLILATALSFLVL